MPVSILVLYVRKNLAIEVLARSAAMDVDLAGAAIYLKRTTETTQSDLLAADGPLLGSPNWSGITGSLDLVWSIKFDATPSEARGSIALVERVCTGQRILRQLPVPY